MIYYGTVRASKTCYHEIHVCIPLAFSRGVGRESQGHGRACGRASARVDGMA